MVDYRADKCNENYGSDKGLKGLNSFCVINLNFLYKKRPPNYWEPVIIK